MKPFQAYRLDRIPEKSKLPDGTPFEFTRIEPVPLQAIWAISPEEALRTIQSDHPFPHRLAVEPISESKNAFLQIPLLNSPRLPQPRPRPSKRSPA